MYIRYVCAWWCANKNNSISYGSVLELGKYAIWYRRGTIWLRLCVCGCKWFILQIRTTAKYFTLLFNHPSPPIQKKSAQIKKIPTTNTKNEIKIYTVKRYGEKWRQCKGKKKKKKRKMLETTRARNAAYLLVWLVVVYLGRNFMTFCSIAIQPSFQSFGKDRPESLTP